MYSCWNSLIYLGSIENKLPRKLLTSKEFQEFMIRNHIKHITGATYHPATNGQAERTIQTLKNKLKSRLQISLGQSE